MFLEDILIRKKDNSLNPYDFNKILAAVNKYTERARGKDLSENITGELTDMEASMLQCRIENVLMQRSNNIVHTEYLHSLIEQALREIAPDVAEVYFKYHSHRLDTNQEYMRLMAQCNEASVKGNTDNANADSTLSSTMRSYCADFISGSWYENFFLTTLERKIIKEGYIYTHDKTMRMIYALNCCLLRAKNVLDNGVEINNIWYSKPKSLDVAFDVLGDIISMGASQQYGGFTVPRVDYVMEEYAEMTYQNNLRRYLAKGIRQEVAEEMAEEDIEKDFRQGFQGWEMKFNTVASSRGDFPFITITLGLQNTKWGRMCCKACYNVRKEGQGKSGHKRPVLFPKIVFLYDENLHGPGKDMRDVYDAAIACSASAMYPDWLSLTGRGYVADMYKKYGQDGVISPMGCRAFLSPWYERGGMYPDDENDKPVFEGRFNIGAISLNLPMILAKANRECRDFYEVLDYYLNVIRQLHLRTYAYLEQMPASKNPIGFCHGGFYGGNLKPSDKIKPVLRHATASFGVTALNELQRLYNGNSLYEEGSKYIASSNAKGCNDIYEVVDALHSSSEDTGFFALDVLRYINKKVQEFKNEDKRLYAIYGTPAEKLCGTQVQQFRNLYGVIENVSSRSYVSNSFHCHVTEDISPIQKQNVEYLFWEYCNGGKIQYCRYNLGYNTKAIETMVDRAMDMGYYEGVNLSLDYCDDCGYQQVEMGDTCPICGSKHVTQIDRMNGYLGISRAGKYVDENGYNTSRFNAPKMDEINERKSM